MDFLKDILIMPVFASVDAANIKYTFRFVGFLVDVASGSCSQTQRVGLPDHMVL